MQILLTGGIGDFFAIESLMTESEANSVEHIFYATRQEGTIRELLKGYPMIFPNLREQISLFNAFTEPYTDLFSIGNRNKLKSLPLLVNGVDIDSIADFSMIVIGTEFMNGKRSHKGSSFLFHEVVKIKNLLPSRDFVFIHPYSNNAPTNCRDLSQSEWDAVLIYLNRRNLVGLVVNQGNASPPSHKSIIDMTNKVNILEAIQILKESRAFIGASSCFSVLAAKIHSPNNLFVKGHNVLKLTWWKPYYMPQITNAFISDDLTANLIR